MNRKVFPLELYRRVLKRAKLDEDFYHAIISEYIELLDEHYELHNLEESVTDWESENPSYIDSLLTTGNYNGWFNLYTHHFYCTVYALFLQSTSLKKMTTSIPTYDLPQSPILIVGFFGILFTLVLLYFVNRAYFNSPLNQDRK